MTVMPGSEGIPQSETDGTTRNYSEDAQRLDRLGSPEGMNDCFPGRLWVDCGLQTVLVLPTFAPFVTMFVLLMFTGRPIRPRRNHFQIYATLFMFMISVLDSTNKITTKKKNRAI